MKTALFPGSFDPITLGHLDIIRRGLETVADRIIVAIGKNPSKTEPLFTVQERMDMIREQTGAMLQTMYPGRVVVPENKIEVVSYSGLTAQYAQARGVSFILRGIRDPADLAYELQQSTVNRVVGSIDTVFLLTQIQNAFVSSGYIRQVVQLGCRELARLKVWLPEAVAVKVLERIPEIGSPGSFLQQFQEKVAPDTSQHAGAKTMVLSATREGRGSD